MHETPAPAACFCGAPTGDGGHLCRLHTSTLTTDLRAVPDLWNELDTTRTRQDKLVINQGSPSGAESPLFWNENAAQVAWEMKATINAWALDVSRIEEDERDPLGSISQYDVPEVARWLARNISTLRLHVDAGTAHEELTDAIRRGHRAIDRPETRTRFEVGPCPEPVDGGHCAGMVWAYIPYNEDKVSYMRCMDCTGQWDTTQWLRVGRRILVRRNQLRSA